MEVSKYLLLGNNLLYYISMGSFIFFSCYSVERDCKKFHKGSFEFNTLIQGQIKTSYFTRIEDLEIENYEGRIDSARIRWINDCECILTKLNPKSNQDKRPVHIKILSTEENSYNFEYSLVGQSVNKQRGTIKKLK